MIPRTLVVLVALILAVAGCSRAPAAQAKPTAPPRLSTAPWLWAGVQKPKGDADAWTPLVALSDAAVARRKAKLDDPLDGMADSVILAARVIAQRADLGVTFKPYELRMADGTPGLVDTNAVTDAMTAAGRELAEKGRADDAKMVSDALLILAYWQLNGPATGDSKHLLLSATSMQEGAAKVRAKMDDAKLKEMNAPTATELRRWFSGENAALAAWVEANHPAPTPKP